MTEAEFRAKWTAHLAILDELEGSRPRGHYFEQTPDEFWIDMLDTYGTIAAAAPALHISQGYITKTLRTRKIPYDTSHTTAEHRERFGALRDEADAHKAMVAELCLTTEPVELPDTADYMIFADIHYPTFSPLWIARQLAVAEFYGIRSAIFIGDTVTLDIISKFADIDRKERAPLQAELERLDMFLKWMGDHFDDMTFLVGNHELRFLRLLRGHVNASYLYKKLLDQKFVEADHLFIGNGERDGGGIRLVHRWQGKGRKATLSEVIEWARSNRQDTFAAHSHRFAWGWTNEGYRAGMLGGAFDEREMVWRQRGTNYIQWERGFCIYRAKPWRQWNGRRYIDRHGLIHPFTDGMTDWGDYGCE